MPTPEFSQSLRKALLVVSGVALFVLAAFYLLLPAQFGKSQSADYLGFYEPAALSLLEGGEYVDSKGKAALRYPPGYPLVLAAAFKTGEILGVPRSSVIVALTFLLFALGGLGVFLLSFQFWGLRGGWIAALVWLTYPPGLWMAKQPNSELLFAPLLLACLIWFWRLVDTKVLRAGPALGLGLLIGVTMLVRPAAIGLGVILASLYYLFQRPVARKRALLGAALILLGNLLAIAPWEAWMYGKTGRILPLSRGGAPSMADGLTFGVRDRGYREGTWVPEIVLPVMEEIHAGYGEGGLDTSQVLALVKEQLVARPGGVASLFLLKAARSWYGTDSQRYELALLAFQLPYLIAGAIALWFCWRGPPELRRLAFATVILVGYFWGMSTLTASLARYMVPAYALLAAVIPAALSARPRGVSAQQNPEIG